VSFTGCIVINSLALAPKRDVRITGVRLCPLLCPEEEALLLKEEPWQMFVVYEPHCPDMPQEGYEAVLITEEDAMLNGFTCTFAEYMDDPNAPPLRI
jgi:hypothetical protein